jgi:ribonuclease Z
VKPGDEFELKKEKYVLRVIKCTHSTPTVGYAFYKVANKLKEEYASLPGKEIGALRKKGIQVTKPVKTPNFVYVGDTTHAVFKVSYFVK